MLKNKKIITKRYISIALAFAMIISCMMSGVGIKDVSAASKKTIKFYDGEVSYDGNQLGTGEIFSCKDDKYLYVVGSNVGLIAYDLETGKADPKFNKLPEGQFLQQDDKYLYYITRLKETSKRTQSIIRVSKETGKKKVLLKKSKSKSKFGGFSGLTLMDKKLYYQYYHDAKSVSQNYTYVTKYSVDTYSMKTTGKSNKKEKKVKLKANKKSYQLKSEYAELSGNGHITGKKGIKYSEEYRRMYYPDSSIKITITKLAGPKKEETNTEEPKTEEKTEENKTEVTKTGETAVFEGVDFYCDTNSEVASDVITGVPCKVGEKHSVKVKAYSIRYTIADDYVVCFAEHWKKTGKRTCDVYIMQCDDSKMKKIYSGNIK